MGRKANVPVAGSTKRLPVKLSEDVALDLWAFCEIHHGAPQNRVVEKAVKQFIITDLEKNPALRADWEELRNRMRSKAPLHIVKFDTPAGGSPPDKT
jgi:hypothetical protein